MFRLLLLSTLICLSVAPVAAADADKGKDIAIEHCRRCHVIRGESNMSVGNSPSFKAMITSEAEDWRDKFDIFYALRPHLSFVILQEFRTEPEFPLGIAPIYMSLRDVEHLGAYVDLLAKDLRK